MPTPAEQHYTARQALVLAAATHAAQQWSQVDENYIAQSWQRLVPNLATVVAGAQLAAAQSADPYVQAVLEAEGVPPAVQAALIAAAFVGEQDGGDLLDVLYQPAITALVGLKGGAPVQRAFAAGFAQLDMLVRTEIADAGRTADQVSATVNGAGGYVRLVMGATCSRCIILAGRVYSYSTGFERHPRCDCLMVPVSDVSEAELAVSPDAVYASMTPAERSYAGWSKAEQQAIADGADLARVTNIHRGGLYVVGGRQFTYERAGRARRRRITPRQIYREAAGSREEAIRLLRLHGYIR